ncbi:MAG TPA: hypothetical protein VN775_13710 [Opitutaceae bacterium]|nr:hypothetical protein [Opitutaceae bacterium]
MPPRALPVAVAVAVAALLLAACGDEQVATYRVPKEKGPELPSAAAGGRGEQSPGAAMADASVPTASGADLVWEAPAAWKAAPAGAMRKASYAVPGEGGESELSITAFPGDVGGELANVNRWRGQVGLAPLRAEELESAVSRVEANGLRFAIVELFPPGDPGAKAMVGAIVPFGGSTWFFKLTGPGALVRASRPAFTGFLHTVRAP